MAAEAEAGVDVRPGPGAVAGVVLAAGLSRRTGARNKLLLPVDGEAMVRRVVATGLAAGLDPVVVVTGHDTRAVEAALSGLAATRTRNETPESGLASSLARGLKSLPAETEAAVILLADMPWVEAATIRALTAAFDPGAGRSVCVPTHRGRRGNPVLWGAEHFAAMTDLRGDTGARVLLERHAHRIHAVEVDDPGILRDVDTLDAWRSATRS